MKNLSIGIVKLKEPPSQRFQIARPTLATCPVSVSGIHSLTLPQIPISVNQFPPLQSSQQITFEFGGAGQSPRTSAVRLSNQAIPRSLP